MKIGISYDIFDGRYGRWGDGKYQKMREHGYSCMDFDMCNTNTPIYELSEKEFETLIMREKHLADEAGIEISQTHGPWRWPAQDATDMDRLERMEKMKRSIRATALLNCKNWVIHPIMPYGVCETGTDNAQKTWDVNLTFMSELLYYAKTYGITICLENMPMKEFSLAKPTDVLKFVKTINDDNFKICFDTGHAAVFDEPSVGYSVRKLGKEIKTFHIHDTKYGMDLHLFPYSGIIDWKDFVKALKDIDFKGVFSLETIPSAMLNDEIFSDMCISLRKIAQQILSDE